MFEGSRRLNIPSEMIANMEAIYGHPKFKMRDNGGKSEYKKQNSGITQGCPLSPYIFLSVMTVMFADIHSRIGRTIMSGKMDGLYFRNALRR